MAIAMVFFATAGVGCSANYQGERLMWKAEQLRARMMASETPDGAPEVLAAYERVLRTLPGTLWAARAQAAIGSVYAATGAYEQARAAYGEVLDRYDVFRDLCIGSQRSIAKTYEVERNWPEAAAAYQQLADAYPAEVAGLEAPLLAARMYQDAEEPRQAARAYAEAVSRYTRLINEAEGVDRARVQGYLALAYQRQEDWPRAVNVLEQLAEAPDGANRPFVLMALMTIYRTKLHTPARADAAMARLLREFPDHPFAKATAAWQAAQGRATPEAAAAQAEGL